MLSKTSKEIVKDVDRASNSADIELLLKKYQEKTQKDFIQKYAETKIAVISSKVTILAYLFALMALIAATILSISLSYYDEFYNNIRNLNEFMLVVLIIFFIMSLILFVSKLFEKDVLEDIILAIQEDKMAIQE